MTEQTGGAAPGAAPGTTDGTAGPGAGPAGAGPGQSGPTPGSGADTLQRLWTAMRRTGVRRPSDDRWLGGVCSGVARRLGVDPVLLRVALVGLTLLGGIGIVAYAVALVLLPDADGRIELERAAAGDLTGTTVGAVALLLLAVVTPAPWDVLRGGRLVEGGDLVGALVLGTLLLIGLAFLPRLAAHGAAAGQTTEPTMTYRTDASTPPPTQQPYPPSGHPDPAAYQWTPPPPRPPRVERPGPGAAVSGAVVGTALLVAGGLWLATWDGALDGRPVVIALAGALTVLGAAIVGLGLAGRRDGAVGGAAFLAVVVAVSVLLVPSWRTTQLAGDITWRPASVSAAERGGSLGLGTGVLDLRALPEPADGEVVEVPVRTLVGTLEVVVPDGLDVQVDAATVVGSVRGGGREEEGVGVGRTVSRGGDPAVVVDARVLVGEIVIREVEEQ